MIGASNRVVFHLKVQVQVLGIATLAVILYMNRLSDLSRQPLRAFSFTSSLSVSSIVHACIYYLNHERENMLTSSIDYIPGIARLQVCEGLKCNRRDDKHFDSDS